MRQLGELNKNGAKEFEKLGVKVVAVFREEKEGLAGLQKIKAKTRVPFTLAIDTPASATKAYSTGNKEFDNYVVDKDGVIRGVIDGSLKSRAKSAKLIEIVKSVESDSSSMAGSAGSASGDDKAAVKTAVMSYVEAMHQGKMEMIEKVVHPSANMMAVSASNGISMSKNYSQIMEAAAMHKASGEMAKHSPKVEVLDVTGNLASAKLTSPRGAAMMQLVKENGQWKILQVVSHMSKK